MIKSFQRGTCTLVACLLLAACGGNGEPGEQFSSTPIPPPVTTPPVNHNTEIGSWNAPDAVVPLTGNYVYLESTNDDSMMAGIPSYMHLTADSTITVTKTSEVTFAVDVVGAQTWHGDFSMPGFLSGLVTSGNFSEVKKFGPIDPLSAGMHWSGGGRTCGTLTGWLVLGSFQMVGNEITQMNMRFEQHCGAGAPMMHGQIRYLAPGATPVVVR
jgi:hypothetical protein